MTKKAPHTLKTRRGRYSVTGNEATTSQKPLPKKKAAAKKAPAKGGTGRGRGAKSRTSKKAAMVHYPYELVRNVLAVPLPVQPSLFDSLSTATFETLKRELDTEEDGVKAWINKKGEALSLSLAEDKLLHCLQVKLKEQSEEAADVTKPGFYMGKSRDRFVCNVDGREFIHECPQVEVSRYELAKLYDGKNPAGSTEQRIEKMLFDFDSDKHSYPLRYIAEAYRDSQGELHVKEITRYERLLRIEKTREVTITTADGKLRKKSQGYRITFHPLFSQFYRGYIAVREDAHNKLQATQRADSKLHLFLVEQWSHRKRSKEWTTQANENELFQILYPKDHRADKWEKMDGNFLGALEACKRSGVLLAARRMKGSHGQDVWEFSLNPAYDNDEGEPDFAAL